MRHSVEFGEDRDGVDTAGASLGSMLVASSCPDAAAVVGDWQRERDFEAVDANGARPAAAMPRKALAHTLTSASGRAARPGGLPPRAPGESL